MSLPTRPDARRNDGSIAAIRCRPAILRDKAACNSASGCAVGNRRPACLWPVQAGTSGGRAQLHQRGMKFQKLRAGSQRARNRFLLFDFRIQLLCGFGSLRMIVHICGQHSRFGGRQPIDPFENCRQGIRRINGLGQYLDRNPVGFDFLTRAVSQKRRMRAQRNAQTPQLILPTRSFREGRQEWMPEPEPATGVKAAVCRAVPPHAQFRER